MGFGLITAGLFFIFNPYVNVIDVLPDIVGYLLILAGTHKLSLMNADIMTSRRYFNAMMWISAGRIAATLLLMRFNDGVLALTLTLAAAVVDCVYAIRAFTLLFSALDTTACMLGDTDSTPYAAKQFTPIAIISKNLLALIPEFTELSVEDEYGNVGLVAYKSMFSLVCVIIGLAVGVVWLVVSVGYINSLSKNKALVSALETRYNAEIASDTALFTRLDLTSFFRLFPLPLFFLLQLNFDGYYIMPEFLCPAVLIILLSRIRRYTDVSRAVYAAGASCAVLTLKYVMMLRYSARFASYAYPYEEAGFLTPYLSYVIPAAVGFILLAIAYADTVKNISDIARLHTGETPRGDSRLDDLNMRVADGLVKRFRVNCVLTVILCVSLIPSSALAAFFNMGYIFAIVLDAVVIYITYTFCAEMTEQISRRYL